MSVRTSLICLGLLFGVGCASAPPAPLHPQFEDYPATEGFEGKPAQVDFKTHPASAKFQKILNSQAIQGPNFAGQGQEGHCPY